MSEKDTNRYVEAGANDALRLRAFAEGITSLNIRASDYAAAVVAYAQSMPKDYVGVSVVFNDKSDKAKMDAWARENLIPSIERAASERRPKNNY